MNKFLFIAIFWTFTVQAQSEIEKAARTLVVQANDLIKKNTCNDLRDALQLLYSYEILAKKSENLNSLNAQIIEYQQKLAKCNNSSSSSFNNAYTPIGSFASFSVKAEKSFDRISMPTFVFATHFMTETAREEYLKSLDQNSITFFNEYQKQNPDKILQLEQTTKPIIYSDWLNTFNNSVKSLNYSTYSVDGNTLEKMKKDILKSAELDKGIK